MANLNIIIPEDVHKKLKIDAIKQDKSLKDMIIKKLKEGMKE